jgi:hypothetical protein
VLVAWLPTAVCHSHDKNEITLHSVEHTMGKSVGEAAPHILLDEPKELGSLKNPINYSLDLSREGGSKPGLPRLIEYRCLAILKTRFGWKP